MKKFGFPRGDFIAERRIQLSLAGDSSTSRLD